MNKELEALKEARNFRHEKDKNLVVIDIDYFNKCLDGIKRRIEELEETNHSMYLREYENAKKLKALEIIKKKVIPYSVWNRSMIERAFDEGWITPEEYNLLKEVLL